MTSQDTKKSRRTWRLVEEDALIICLKELEGTLYKQDGIFKSGYLKELEDKMNSKLPGCGILQNPHIDSKLKLWKKHYNAISTLLSYSGVGWDDTTKTVNIDDEPTWNDMIMKVPAASEIKKKSFRLYDDWVEIFGKDRATGEFAETPIDVDQELEEIKNSNNHKDDNDDDANVSNDVVNKGKETKHNGKKRKRRSGGEWEFNMEQVIEQGLEQFSQRTSKSVEMMATMIGADYEASKKRGEVNAKVQVLGLGKMEELRATTLICTNQAYCDLFESLSEEDRVTWVRMLLNGEFR